MSVFVNSARKLYLSDGAATPTLTLVPTIKFDETPQDKSESFYSSSDVSGGVAYERTIISGKAMEYSVETKQFTTDDATPALNTALATIAACKKQSGANAELDFVIVEPDGTMDAVNCTVMNVKTLNGNTEDVAALTFTMRRNGPPVTYEGALP